MTPDDIQKLDTQKLHAESNQLRNQQFVLGTLALGAVGYSSWLIPALSGGSKDDSANGIATISLLVLLSILFTWSIALRRLIGTISQYLEVHKMSRWEPDMRQFTDMKGTGHWSPTTWVMIVYLALGSVLVINFFLVSATAAATLSPLWTWAVVLSTVAYVIYVYALTSTCRDHDTRAGLEWRKMLGLPEEPPHASNRGGP